MQIALILIFILGYAAIVFEHQLKIDKAATALIAGVLCWTVFFAASDVHEAEQALMHHMGDISAILFFLLAAMTIVELIDAHDGFRVITRKIPTTSASKLIWIIALITFFLSAVLDNLTTAILMVSLNKKIIKEQNLRLLFAGVVVIAANAGGAWSPIGDVTTTMLWVKGNISTLKIIATVFVPGLLCVLLPTWLISRKLSGKVIEPVRQNLDKETPSQLLILCAGIAVLMGVPFFKYATGMPPFMGILLGLGLIWLLSEFIHSEKDHATKSQLSVVTALRKIDTSSILFFLGILMAINALASAKILENLSHYLDASIGNQNVIVGLIGVLSAIVDNVPIVAAAQGMYQFGVDHPFWLKLAYTAGTGGSMLIIGSAAGVAAMGLEKIKFGWYLKHISGLAALGYMAGLIYLILMS